jgi:hypothetical protein
MRETIAGVLRTASELGKIFRAFEIAARRSAASFVELEKQLACMKVVVRRHRGQIKRCRRETGLSLEEISQYAMRLGCLPNEDKPPWTKETTRWLRKTPWSMLQYLRCPMMRRSLI